MFSQPGARRAVLGLFVPQPFPLVPSWERPSLVAARYPFWPFVRHIRAVGRYWPLPGRATLDSGVMRMLAFDGAAKRFGPVTALDGCTFAARPGRLTRGDSGCLRSR